MSRTVYEVNIGEKYNLLTVIGKEPKNIRGIICQCECGNITNAKASELVKGTKKSCGCLKYKKNDLTGQTFGNLTVIKQADEKIGEARAWECQCKCGNIVIARTGDLTSGSRTSCGCGNPLRFNLVGQKFNKLTVIEKIGSENQKTIWKCQCECGNITTATTDQLRGNHKKSCGCIKNESNAIDLKGQRFGILRVSKRVGTAEGRKALWRCRCDCGKYVTVRATDLKNGNTKSCGCLGKHKALATKLRKGVSTHEQSK